MSFNSFLYNNNLYNSQAPVASEADQDNIVFNGYSLQNANIVTSQALYDQTPTRELPTNKIPRNDGEFIIGDFWRAKVITLRGTVRGSSAADLNSRIDAMKKALAVRGANLDIKIDGTIRRFKATMIGSENLFSRRNYHNTFIPYEAQFLCVVPWGQATTYTESLFTDKTGISSTEFVNNAGTIHAAPVISLNFSTASSITAVSVTNDTTGETISATVSLSAADIIVFDSENFTVKKNGTAIDYSGSFPKLATGSNSFTITLTGTSATFTLSIKHKTSYL